MADTIKEFIEIPQSFVKEGTQFMTRCTKPSQKGE
jgi:protein transport protein SEC61 subunit gamma-like protein